MICQFADEAICRWGDLPICWWDDGGGLQNSQSFAVLVDDLAIGFF